MRDFVNRDLDHILSRFSGRRVLVIGDAMLDTYLTGNSERLCQEAPVPVVSLTGRSDMRLEQKWQTIPASNPYGIGPDAGNCGTLTN